MRFDRKHALGFLLFCAAGLGALWVAYLHWEPGIVDAVIGGRLRLPGLDAERIARLRPEYTSTLLRDRVSLVFEAGALAIAVGASLLAFWRPIRRVTTDARFGAAVLGALFSLVLIGFAEVALRAVSDPGEKRRTEYPQHYYEWNEWNLPIPFEGDHPSAAFDPDSGEEVYSVVYSVDGHGRRITPAPGRRDRFLLVFGGSFAYGEGVGENETLPAQLSRRLPCVAAYNYGFHGLGPFDALAKLESVDLPSEVAERRGAALYLFIDNHIKRATNAMSVTSWHSSNVYYRQDASGELRWRRSFVSAQPIRTRLLGALSESRLLRRIGLDLPLGIRDEHVRLAAKALAQGKERFQERYPDSPFLVVIHPGSEQGPRLVAQLEELGVAHLDYADLIDVRDPAYTISPIDPHPSVLAHATLAEALARDLASLEVMSAASCKAAPGGD